MDYINAPFITRYATGGMIATTDHLASAAGLTMLTAGGNAVDMAIAANAVLTVIAQHQCGMGGDLFVIVHIDGQAQPHVLNASGRSGSGADAEALRAAGHARMPLRQEIRTVTVPGCVDGWLTLHRRFGSLPLDKVLAPAIHLAARGFPAGQSLVPRIELIGGLPGADDYQHVRRAGDLIKRPGVARVLRAIITDGRTGFYGGEFGSGLLALGAGEFTQDDLSAPISEWVEPLGVRAWEHDIWTVPPNSQGYLALAASRIAEKVDIPTDPTDPVWAHRLIESVRQASFDRQTTLHEHADGAFLVSEARLAPRRDRIRDDAVASVNVPGGDGDTNYLCAVDGHGMSVSLIQSNAHGFGSHLVEPNTRVFLHNRGIGFSLESGHPAEYKPNARPPHTLAPLMVTTPGGDVKLVVGTMGADSQPQVLLQLLARVLVAGQDPATAIAAGRWTLVGPGTPHEPFDTWDDPDNGRLKLEGHTPTTWDHDLRGRGHRVERTETFDSGYGHAHMILSDRGVFGGASDPRALTAVALGI